MLRNPKRGHEYTGGVTSWPGGCTLFKKKNFANVSINKKVMPKKPSFATFGRVAWPLKGSRVSIGVMHHDPLGPQIILKKEFWKSFNKQKSYALKTILGMFNIFRPKRKCSNATKKVTETYPTRNCSKATWRNSHNGLSLFFFWITPLLLKTDLRFFYFQEPLTSHYLACCFQYRS